MNQEWEQDSDEDSVIFTTNKTRRYVKNVNLQTNESSSVPSAAWFQNCGKERLMNGHIPTTASHNNYQALSNFYHPGHYQADRIQLTKQPMNPIQHRNEKSYQGQHWERVKKSRHNNVNSQESRHEREHVALLFRGFNNRYSNQKIQKDVLQNTNLGLSLFLAENETLILKNAWQREIIPGQKMADKLKSHHTTEMGSFSGQSNAKPKTPSPQKLVMDSTISDSNTVPDFLGLRTLNSSDQSVRNDNASDSSLDDSLSGFEELGEILEETLEDMNHSIRENPEDNSSRALTEEPVNTRCNEYESASALCPDVPISSLQKPVKSQSNNFQSKATFSVPEPEATTSAVELSDIVDDIEDTNMHRRCRTYLNHLKCPRGDYCSFLHTLPKTDNVICKDFKLGKCLRTATQCWFKHPGEEIEENTKSCEEGPAREDSIGTLLSLLKTGQNTVAAQKPSHHSQSSSSEFIGKLKISKPKPVGTPRRKTSEQDASSGATDKQASSGATDKQASSGATDKQVIQDQIQITPITTQEHNNDRNVFKGTCSKGTKKEGFANKGVNSGEKSVIIKSSHGTSNDYCREEDKQRSKHSKEKSKLSHSIINDHDRKRKSGICDENNACEFGSREKETKKNKNSTNKTVNNVEDNSVIKNIQDSSTINSREKDEQQRSKHKNSEKVLLSDGKNNGGKSNIYDNACKLSLREKENLGSRMSTSDASEYGKVKPSNYHLVKGSNKDSHDESNKSSKDVEGGKKSSLVPKDQYEKHRGSKVKHLRSEDDAHHKSSDPYEKAKRRRTTDSLALVNSENREHFTKTVGLSDDNIRETRDSQNFKSCNSDNLNAVRLTEGASDRTSTVIKTEPESVVDEKPIQFLNVEKFENMKTEKSEFIETSSDMCELHRKKVTCSDMCELHRKKVHILTELTKQWLHDVDENYRSSGDPFDDLCKIIQEMGLEIWKDDGYPDVYIWEVNMRRMFVSLYTSLNLETFTNEIHNVMKDIPDIYEFFSLHKTC